MISRKTSLVRCTLVLWVLLHLQTCGRANSDADDAQSAPAGFEHVEYCGVDPTWRRRKRMELWRMAEALDDFHQPKMMPRKLHPESRRIWLSKDGNLAINFEAPTCVSGQPSIFECQILGLEHAVEYLLSVAVIKKPEKEDPAPELSEGLRTLYQETWLLDKIDDHVKFNVTIPPLSMAQWNCLPYRSAPTASLRVALLVILPTYRQLYAAEKDLAIHTSVAQGELDVTTQGRDIVPQEHQCTDASMPSAKRKSRPTLEEDAIMTRNNVSCALLFFGLAKNFRGIVLPSIRNHLLKFNPSCDVYAHTYNITSVSNPRNDELDCAIHAHEVYMLTDNVLMDDDASFERARPDRLEWRKFHPHGHDWVFPNSIDNVIKEWHSIESVWRLMEARGNTYSRVGLFRLDSLITRPIELHAYSAPGVLCDPSMRCGGLCDRMFYGDYVLAKRWASERFVEARKYVSVHKQLHAETFMAHLMRGFEVEEGRVCVQRVRACGPRGVETSDCTPPRRYPALALSVQLRAVSDHENEHGGAGVSSSVPTCVPATSLLVYRGNVGEGRPGEMKIAVMGAPPGLAYRVTVQEMDPLTGEVLRQKEALVDMRRDVRTAGHRPQPRHEIVQGHQETVAEIDLKLVIFDARQDLFGDRVLPRICRGIDPGQLLATIPGFESQAWAAGMSVCLIPVSPSPSCSERHRDASSVHIACVSTHDEGWQRCETLTQIRPPKGP